MTNWTPFPANSFWTAIVRSSQACTYGQWLHQKETTRIGLSLNEPRECVFPSTPGSEKSGAGEPSGRPWYCVSSMESRRGLGDGPLKDLRSPHVRAEISWNS